MATFFTFNFYSLTNNGQNSNQQQHKTVATLATGVVIYDADNTFTKGDAIVVGGTTYYFQGYARSANGSSLQLILSTLPYPGEDASANDQIDTYFCLSTTTYTSGSPINNLVYNFTTTPDLSSSGSPTDPTPICFLPGTLIATPAGLRPVETLQPGDLVLTSEGPEKVRFLGYTYFCQRTLQAIGRMPVGMEAGAFGELGPERDTFVSPGHALHLQGAMVEAGALINGRSIRQHNEWPHAEQIVYYSIELERHALVWANGLLAESFYPSGDSRLSWNNHLEYVALYGEEVHPFEELALPRILFARQLPAELRALVGLPDLALSI